MVLSTSGPIGTPIGTYITHGPLPPGTRKIAESHLDGWAVIDRTAPINGIKYVDFFLCISGGGRGWFDDVKSRLKCRLNASVLTDKFQLHMALMKIAPETIQPTVEITPETTLPKGAIWMIRANWGWGGNACIAVDKTHDLKLAYSRWGGRQSNNRHRRISARVMASEYIAAPRLFDGYKFHARAYIVVVAARRTDTDSAHADSYRRYYQVAPTIEIVRALNKYRVGNFKSQGIHVTTVNCGKIEDMVGGAELRTNMLALLDEVMTHLLPRVEPYAESENAYEIYAADFMFHDDGRAVVLDINSTPRMEGRVDTIGRELIDLVFAYPFADVFTK